MSGIIRTLNKIKMLLELTHNYTNIKMTNAYLFDRFELIIFASDFLVYEYTFDCWETDYNNK